MKLLRYLKVPIQTMAANNSSKIPRQTPLQIRHKAPVSVPVPVMAPVTAPVPAPIQQPIKKLKSTVKQL